MPGPGGPHPWRLEFRIALNSDPQAASPFGTRKVPLPRPPLRPYENSTVPPRPFPRPLPPPLPPPHRANLQKDPAAASIPADMSLVQRLLKSMGIWKFPDMDRYLAQFLLRFAPTGCFIVRKGSQEGTFALTVRNKTENDCDHYRIFVRCGGLQVEGSHLVFSDVETLIEYYCLHLRELPYLLRLPQPVSACPSVPLLEKFSQMGTAFWSAFYPRPMDEALADTHRNAYAVNNNAASCDTGIGTFSSSLEPRISYLSTKDPRMSYLDPKDPRCAQLNFKDPRISYLPTKDHHNAYLDTKDPRISYLSTKDHHTSYFPSKDPHTSYFPSKDSHTSYFPSKDSHTSYFPSKDLRCLTAVNLSGSSSVDSLLRSCDDHSATSPEGDVTGSSSGCQLTATSSASRSAEELCREACSFRSSVTMRLGGRAQSGDVPPNYEAMWKMGTVPSASSSSPGSAAPLPPPQHECPMDFDLARVPGFPQPERFKPMFTFDGFTPRAARRARPPSSDVYEDPMDLRSINGPGHRNLAPQASLPVAVPSGSNLRAARSDDSLSQRVDPALAQIRSSLAAMEADLAPPLPPHGRVSLRARQNTELDAPPATTTATRRDSFYDNVSSGSTSASQAPSRQPSIASSRGTIFSSPWDTSLWHQVLHPAARGSATSMDALRQVAAAERARRSADRSEEAGQAQEDSDGDATPTLARRSLSDNGRTTPTLKTATLGPEDVLHSVEEADSGHDLVRKAQARLSEFIQPSCGRNVGASIDRWLLDLTQRDGSIFGQKVVSFIECTKDAQEKNPHSVMRNIRQFMDGLKNYLVQRDETGFQKVVENERKKLAADEFLNVERRLESALYIIILQPLKSHVDRLVSDWAPNMESLRRIRENLHLAAQQPPERLGIRSGLQPPQESDLTRIRQCFSEMEAAYSPLVKLECLLKAVEIMYNGNEGQKRNNSSPQLVSTDDLMPIFTYVLVRCELYNAEFEADYMQGLLASKFLLGEGAYYLSTLQAAVQVIKNFHRRSSVGALTTSYEDLSQLHGVLRVIVLDERTDSTNIKTFPARPTMTARDLSILIAHRCHIFNPQDFGLYHFSNGKERRLNDLDLPHQIKLVCEGRSEKPCHLLYRRSNAVFLFPLGLSCGR